MRVSVASFAGVREIVGAATRWLELPEGATAGDLWAHLAREFPALRELESTRVARGGRLIERAAPLAEGDELALLPPFGGG
jgi:molybdopterin converting factor small subunit